ncbi:MAG: cytochrome c [Solirubrobacteraceae bacterium]
MSRSRVKESVWENAQRLIAVIALGVLLCLASGCASTAHPTTTTSSNTSPAAGSPVARGRELYRADGCSGCHSLNGTRMSGPPWKGLAGSRVTLSDGQTLTADDAYLTKHIVEPNAVTVQGYPGDVMAQATETFDLKSKPADVRALVAFIDSVR